MEPGVGGGRGGGMGGGVGAGAGPGRGAAGGRVTLPEPQQLVLPPAGAPKALRGTQVQVTFFVAADGRVEHVAVEPAIPDRGFARKFADVMRSYRFRPARTADGAAVPASTTITVSFF